MTVAELIEELQKHPAYYEVIANEHPIVKVDGIGSGIVEIKDSFWSPDEDRM